NTASQQGWVMTMAKPGVLRAVGYWKTDRQGCPYPDPRLLVQPGWHADELDRIIAYLRAGRVFTTWDGYSYCRFGCCDEVEDLVDAGVKSQEFLPTGEPVDIGASDLFDGVWIWPEGLAHYVERHSVRLPEEFVDYMRSRSWVVPDERVVWEAVVEVEDEEQEDEDHTFWIAWGKRETGGSA